MRVLPVASLLAILLAAMLDPVHDPVQDYISWLVGGSWGWLAGLGVVGLVAASLEVAMRLHRELPEGPVRQAVVTFLACAAVLGSATLALPSQGAQEPAWRTTVHVAMAVGAYAGVAGAAAGLAWLSRQRLAPPSMKWWALGIFLAIAALGVVSAIARLTPWGVELRGLAQLLLVATAAVWMAAATSSRSSRPTSLK